LKILKRCHTTCQITAAFAINIRNNFQHSACWSYNRCCRSLVCYSSNAVGIVSWHKRHSVFKKQSALSLYSFSWISFYFMWDNWFLLSTQQHQNEGDHSSWNEKLFLVFFKVKLIAIKIVINCFLKTKLQYYNWWIKLCLQNLKKLQRIQTTYKQRIYHVKYII